MYREPCSTGREEAVDVWFRKHISLTLDVRFGVIMQVERYCKQLVRLIFGRFPLREGMSFYQTVIVWNRKKGLGIQTN